MLQKVQFNLDADLIRQVDDYASSLHITRTAAVSVLLSRALQADKFTDAFATMMDAYRTEQEGLK